ncbi:MAG: hypothetical protein QOG20_4853, partial [Pseudonocardiales bacterium]|nr:hypothetical protein [Pseudonocardiales bacterium]
AGAENVHSLPGGREAPRTRALVVAAGALDVAANDRRRPEYRISMPTLRSSSARP